MVLIILIPVYYLAVEFFKAFERVAFLPCQVILLLTVCIISIKEFFSVLIKVRSLLSSLKISTRAISGLASKTFSSIVVTKQGPFGRWHLRKFYWLCDFPYKLWIRQKPGPRMSQKSGLLRISLHRNSLGSFHFHPFTLAPAPT